MTSRTPWIITRENAARFLRHVEQTPGCWIWRGNLSDAGYGRVRVHGRLRSARRVAYELWVGPIPPGAMVGRSCGEKACVRPEHMLLIESIVRLSREQTVVIATSPGRTNDLALAWGVSTRHIARLRRVFSGP